MRRLGLSIVAASLLVLMGLAPAAHAAPPGEPAKQKSASEKKSTALKWLDQAQRTRLQQVEPIVVTAEPLPESRFGFQLGKMCMRLAPWKHGTPKAAAALEATLTGPSIAERMDAVSDDPVAIVVLARDLSDTIATLNQVCSRIKSRKTSAEDFALLRKGYYHEFGSSLEQLFQLYDKARKPFEQLLERTAALTTEAMLLQKKADYAALAATFVEVALPEIAGEPASVVPSPASLGAAARKAFAGLAEFLIDRAKEEAITYLREELVNRICAEDADPILFIPNTCKLLADVDPNLSITVMGAALRTAMTSDLELLPDRAMVLAWTYEPEVAYSATGLRILVPLARDARARKSPLEFVAGLHTIATVDCERLSTPGHDNGEQRCADTVALLRMSSMLIHATATQTSADQKPDLPYLTLAVMFALEQRFLRLPEVVQARILVDLGWTEFELRAEHIALFEPLVVEAESRIPDLKTAIEALSEEVMAGDRPPVVDEDMYRLAIRATKDLVSIGQLMLATLPSTGIDGERRKAMAFALTGLSDQFGLAQAYADQDWAAATLGTVTLVDQWLESQGGSEVCARYSVSLQALTRYLPLFIEIANAKSSDEVNRALQAAFPTGGYKRKYREAAISINGFLGIYGGGTLSNSLDASDQLQFGSVGGEFSMFAPIGMHLTGPVGVHRKRPSNVGLLVSVVDLGAITTSKWLKQEVNPEVASGTGTTQTALREPAAFNIAGIVAPGAYFTVGIANSPFVFGLGGSFEPFAQKRTTTGRDSMGDIESTSATFLPVIRFGAFLAVDITFVSFGLR